MEMATSGTYSIFPEMRVVGTDERMLGLNPLVRG